MKIKDTMLKNFADVHEISVSFDDKITFLIGENGAGKTTVGLNGIWFILKGLAQKGDGLIAERFRFIGKHGKSATGTLTIYDKEADVEIKVSRKLLKNKTELKIEASDGRKLDQSWLDSIFSPFCIDPVGFSRLSGKAQALAFGADTSGFDQKKKALELERQYIGRDVARLDGVVKTAKKQGVEKVEAVDIGELMGELDKRRTANEVNRTKRESLTSQETDLEGHRDGLRSFEKQLEAMQRAVAEKKEVIKDKEKDLKQLSGLVLALDDFDEREITTKIENAQEVNLKATAYNQFRENESALEDTQLDYEGKTVAIKDNEGARTKYLQSLDLPWPNITINDEGEFRLNDKPFAKQYFSTGEILKLGARIGSKLKGGLKYVFFPSSNVLDDKNRETVFKQLVDDGFQVVAEYISTKKIPDESCILLKEMRVVESYDDSKGAGLK